MIGQLGGEGGLGRREKNEAAPSASDTGCPTHSVNVLRHRRGGRILQKNPTKLRHSDWLAGGYVWLYNTQLHSFYLNNLIPGLDT